MAGHRQSGNVTRVKAHALRDQDRAVLRFRTAVIDELSWFGALLYHDVFAVTPNMLDHHNRIGSVRHGRTRHDLQSLAALKRSLLYFARPHFAANAQRARDISGFDRESITERTSQRWIVTVCTQRFGQHATVCLF